MKYYLPEEEEEGLRRLVEADPEMGALLEEATRAVPAAPEVTIPIKRSERNIGKWVQVDSPGTPHDKRIGKITAFRGDWKEGIPYVQVLIKDLKGEGWGASFPFPANRLKYVEPEAAIPKAEAEMPGAGHFSKLVNREKILRELYEYGTKLAYSRGEGFMPLEEAARRGYVIQDAQGRWKAQTELEDIIGFELRPPIQRIYWIFPPEARHSSNPANPTKLERCVAEVQKKIDKGELPEGSSAWAICRASLGLST